MFEEMGQQRRQHLQNLLAAARAPGTPQRQLITDGASRVQVLAFMGVLRARAGPPAAKTDAEEAYRAHAATFDKPAAQPARPEEPASRLGAEAGAAAAPKHVRGLRGTSFLLT